MGQWGVSQNAGVLVVLVYTKQGLSQWGKTKHILLTKWGVNILEKNILIEISLKFVFEGPMDNESMLVQLMISHL